MKELFEIAFSPANAALSFMLFGVVLYWLMVILGALDLDFLDIDLDTDMDSDMDHHVDVDLDGHGGHTQGQSWYVGALRFFNFGEAPLMIILTFLTISMWTIGILANYYLGFNSLLLGIIYFIPNLIVSLFITKFLTMPIVKLYKKYGNTYETAIDFLGRTGKLLSPVGEDKVGRAEIMVMEDPIIIYVKSKSGEAIDRDQLVMVMRESDDKKYYYVEKHEQIK